MADPVSWFLIESGWTVVDRDGNEVGSIDEVVGDSTNDIFNGLAISTSVLGKPHYVPAEQVGTITEDRVQLTITKDEVDGLEEFEEPPTTAEMFPAEATRRPNWASTECNASRGSPRRAFCGTT